MKNKKIFISFAPWQTRIAITRDDKLQNVYFDSHAHSSLERAYFKGTITKVLPGIQTAFVDFGQERAGFLHISEVDRDLALRKMTRGASDEEFEETDTEEKENKTRDQGSAKYVDIKNKIYYDVLMFFNAQKEHWKSLLTFMT